MKCYNWLIRSKMSVIAEDEPVIPDPTPSREYNEPSRWAPIDLVKSSVVAEDESVVPEPNLSWVWAEPRSTDWFGHGFLASPYESAIVRICRFCWVFEIYSDLGFSKPVFCWFGTLWCAPYLLDKSMLLHI
jgi:hypothetical protein